MLFIVNIIANLVIMAGTVWALYTQKVPTRTAGSGVLGLIFVAATLNLDREYCHSRPEIMLNLSIAIAVMWAFWRLEIRQWGRA